MDEKLREDSSNPTPAAATPADGEARSSTPEHPVAPGMRFRDALIAAEVLDAEALEAAIAKIGGAPAAHDLPSALVASGAITPQQAKTALFLQMVDRYRHRIAGFEIEAALGQGAVGSVFKAYEPRRDRHVAIKILDERTAKIPEIREAFLSEARAALRLNHPNIVQGYAVGEANEISYYIMEFVEGRTVDELVTARGPMDERQALNIVRDLARALEHAEENGLVHRDIKPANIIVGRNRIAKLLDMGLAKVVVGAGSRDAERGAAVGTPNYMSPEQIRGDRDLGSRADIYSLGATLFFMMTGQPPFSGKPEVVMYKHIHEPPASPRNIRPDCSISIANLIFSMMAKQPDDRPSTATALIEAIDEALVQVGKKIAEAPPMLLPTPPIIGAPEEEAGVRIPQRKRKGRRGRRHPINPPAKDAAQSVKPTPIAPASQAAPEKPLKQPPPKAIPMTQLGKSAPVTPEQATLKPPSGKFSATKHPTGAPPTVPSPNVKQGNALPRRRRRNMR